MFATVGCAEPAPDTFDLGLEMQPQEAAQWCWAAVAQSIASWHGVEATQSEIVSMSFGRECTPEACNSAYSPAKYLHSIGLGLVVPADMWLGPEETIRQQLLAGRTALLVLSNGQFAHFVLISGYTPDGFIVLDPLWAAAWLPERQVLSWLELQDYGPGLHVERVLFVD